MKSYTAPLLFLFLVAYSRAWVQFSLSSWPYDEGKIDYLNDDNDKPKRSESTSSSESSFSSSSSSRSSSSSDSSGGFHVKMEEYEQKTDKSGTHEVTKTFEKKKATGGNETSSSKTVEVIRFPNGTIQRRVKENGPGMKAECTKSEDCGKDRYCNQLFYQCQPCINDFGCFNTDQCCGGKVCKLGKCITQPVRTGLAKSPCDDDNQCKTGLFCSYNVFGGGNCVELRKEGESCNKELFSRMRPNCTQGLECKPTRGLGFILNYKCLKPGSVGDKAASDSPFDWFTWRV